MTRDRTGSRAWIVLLGLASGLSTFGMASLVPALPALSVALNADFGAIQFVVSVYLLGLGLAQPVQGLLCDRYGRRPVLLAGFAAFAVASVAAAFATSLALLVAARFLQALGVSVGTVVARAMVRDTHDVERAAVSLSFITAVMGIAPIVGPIAGGLAVENLGWRAIFFMHALIGAALLAWMVVALHETRPRSARSAPAASHLRGFAMLLRDGPFLGYTLLYGFVSGAMFTFLTVGADLFERQFGIGATRFGLLWAVLAAAFACGAWIAGTGARRFGMIRMLRFGVALNCLAAGAFCAAAFLPTPQLAAYMIALTLLIAANGLIGPLALMGAVGKRPELAGLASGLSSSLAMLTTVLFSAVSGALYHGTPGPIAMLMVLAAAGATLAARAATRNAVSYVRR